MTKKSNLRASSEDHGFAVGLEGSGEQQKWMLCPVGLQEPSLNMKMEFDFNKILRSPGGPKPLHPKCQHLKSPNPPPPRPRMQLKFE